MTEKGKPIIPNRTGRRPAGRSLGDVSGPNGRRVFPRICYFPTQNTRRMGQQVGRVGEGASAGIQTPPQGQQQQGRSNRASSSGRRPRDGGSNSNITGTPPGRAAAAAAAANIMLDPGINVFTLHSGMNPFRSSLCIFIALSLPHISFVF